MWAHGLHNHFPRCCKSKLYWQVLQRRHCSRWPHTSPYAKLTHQHSSNACMSLLANLFFPLQTPTPTDPLVFFYLIVITAYYTCVPCPLLFPFTLSARCFDINWFVQLPILHATCIRLARIVLYILCTVCLFYSHLLLAYISFFHFHILRSKFSMHISSQRSIFFNLSSAFLYIRYFLHASCDTSFRKLLFLFRYFLRVRLCMQSISVL